MTLYNSNSFGDVGGRCFPPAAQHMKMSPEKRKTVKENVVPKTRVKGENGRAGYD